MVVMRAGITFGQQMMMLMSICIKAVGPAGMPNGFRSAQLIMKQSIALSITMPCILPYTTMQKQQLFIMKQPDNNE